MACGTKENFVVEESGEKVSLMFVFWNFEILMSVRLPGLVTFSDATNGFPRHEGHFQDCKFMKRLKCGDVVQRAQKVALLARALVDQH